MPDISRQLNDELQHTPGRRERPAEHRPEVVQPAGAGVEERGWLGAALQRLPAQQRAILLLRHWLGLSVTETAIELGISEGTVKSHCSRAVTAMRSHLTATDSLG